MASILIARIRNRERVMAGIASRNPHTYRDNPHYASLQSAVAAYRDALSQLERVGVVASEPVLVYVFIRAGRLALPATKPLHISVSGGWRGMGPRGTTAGSRHVRTVVSSLPQRDVLPSTGARTMTGLPFLPFMRQTLVCEHDGFPLVDIAGQQYCSVEYADGLIGGQKVLGIGDSTAENGGLIEILFSGGSVLPLTCPCCGGALHLKPRTLPEMRALLIGRSVEGFRHGEWVGKGVPPQRHPIFAVQFSGTEERSERTIELSLASVRRLTQRGPGASRG